MQPFLFERAVTIESALNAAARGARLMAGATNLFDLMKLGVETPSRVVDISSLPLRGIEQTAEGGFTIGALTSNTAIADDKRLRTAYPLVSQATLSGATQQIRNAATLGGNLLQRTRCPYFQDIQVDECNKRRPGSGCAARQSIDRLGAVLGAPSDCIATMPSDLAVALTAVDAEVELTSLAGTRRLRLADFYAPAFASAQRESALEPGELLTAVQLPPCPEARNSIYEKVRERASYAFALVSVAAAMSCDGAARISSLRVAIGNVAPGPWRSWDAERLAIGAPMHPATFARVAGALLKPATLGRTNGFKLEIARRVLIRALTGLGEKLSHGQDRTIDTKV